MRWFQKLRAGMGLRRSNCSHGAARRGSLPGRTPLPRCRSSCLRSWNQHCRKGAVRRRQRARPEDRASGIIELEIEGVSVRVGRGADAETVAVVIRALKAGT